MRILFINQLFPGQLGPLAASFAADKAHEVFFVSGYSRRGFSLPGVRQVVLPSLHDPKKERKSGLPSEADRGLRAARQALKSFHLLRQNGFTPDMVVVNTAWEYWLYGPKVFPDAFVVCYPESPVAPGLVEDALKGGFFRTLLQARQILESHLCVSRTLGEESPWAGTVRTAVALPYPVDTDFFAPQSQATKPDTALAEESPLLVVGTDTEYVAHIFRMADTILTRLPQRRIILLFSDPTARAQAGEILQGCAPAHKQRLSLPEAMPLREYRDLLRSAAAVVIANPHPRPGFLLEAMSCGAAVILCPPADVPDMFRHGWNLIQAAWQDLAQELDTLLHDHTMQNNLRIQARHTVLEHFSLAKVAARHRHLLEDAYRHWLSAKR